MYVRGRLRDLKARTKTRFKGTLLSATTSNPAGSATEAPTGPTVPASISNLPSASPSTCALAAPPVNFAGTVTEISSFTPTPESSSITISPGHAPRAWENLRALPRVLDPVAGAFGPLKAIVDELVGFLDIYEMVANGRAEYSKLHYELELLCGESKQHFSHPIEPPVTTGVESLCKSIQEELDWVSQKQVEGNTRKHLEGRHNPDEILACYRRVQSLSQPLSLNVNVSIWKLAEKQIREIRSDRMSTQLDRLSLSFSAFYNSAHAMELKRGSCTPGTRVNVLNQIHSWVRNPIQGSIYWLNGMAGTGKTTIVHTLSAALDKEHKLAASFFCSRLLPECRKLSLIIPSIAYQLARLSLPIRSVLSQILEKDPDVHTRLPDVQFNAMIVEPLPTPTIQETLTEGFVVVIDALDECDNKESTGKILEVLLANARDLPITKRIEHR